MLQNVTSALFRCIAPAILAALVLANLTAAQSATHFSPTSNLSIWSDAWVTPITPTNVPLDPNGHDFYFDINWCVPSFPPAPFTCTDSQGNPVTLYGWSQVRMGKTTTGGYPSILGGYDDWGSCGDCASVKSVWTGTGNPTFSVPAGITPGTRYIMYRIGGPGSAGYGDSAPVMVKFTIPDTIDLGVKGFDVLNEESICVGSQATFAFKVFNWGQLPSYSPHVKLVAFNTKDLIPFVEVGNWALNTTIPPATYDDVAMPFQETFTVPQSIYGMKYFRAVVYDSSIAGTGWDSTGETNGQAPNISHADKCSLQPDFSFVGDGLVWDSPDEDAPVPLYSEQIFKFKFTYQNIGRGATEPDSKVILELMKGDGTWWTAHEFPFPDSLACHSQPQTSPEYEWRLSSDPTSPYYYPYFVIGKTRALRLRFQEANDTQETLNNNSHSKAKKIKLVEKPNVSVSLQRGAWTPEGRAWGQPDFTTIPPGQPCGAPNVVTIRTPGNSIQVTATVTGGPRRLKFSLTGVSAEPGICMNYGASTDCFYNSPDLQFIQSGSPNVVNSAQVFDAPASDGLSITTTNKVNSQAVTVTCYDYGAYGNIGAQVVDKSGNPIGIDAQDPNGIVAAPKTLPKDDNNNQISDDWYGNKTTDAFGNVVDESAGFDGENEVGDPAKPGDGLTRYEEYRGFMMNSGSFARMSPFIKEVFICRDNASFPIGMFNNAISCIDVNSLQMNGAAVDGTPGAVNSAIGPRVINFNADAVFGHHAVYEHGLWVKVMLQNNPQDVDDWGIALTGDENKQTSAPSGPPKYHGIIHVHADNITKSCKQGTQGVTTWWWDATVGSPSTKDRLIDETTAHECGHGVGIQHHLDFPSDPAYTVHILNYPDEDKVTFMATTGSPMAWDHDRHWEMGVVDCVMRYTWLDIEAAIAGDQNKNGHALETGEAVDTDWVPTLVLVDTAHVFCTGAADELPKVGNASNAYPHGSNDNCLGQIVVSDHW